MIKDRKILKLVLLGSAGILLFCEPIISIVDRPVFLMGVPRLYVYVFTVWLVLIVLAWRLAEGKPRRRKGGQP